MVDNCLAERLPLFLQSESKQDQRFEHVVLAKKRSDMMPVSMGVIYPFSIYPCHPFTLMSSFYYHASVNSIVNSKQCF